jgi:hypothetical protein
LRCVTRRPASAAGGFDGERLQAPAERVRDAPGELAGAATQGLLALNVGAGLLEGVRSLRFSSRIARMARAVARSPAGAATELGAPNGRVGRRREER